MKIKILSRFLFTECMKSNNINDNNIEEKTDTFIISINNTDEKSYFNSEHENVKIMYFDDCDEDCKDDKQEFKTFTKEQAKELFEYIKENKDREVCLVHCSAGWSRSGAVGLFINDYLKQNHGEFKKENPVSFPSFKVYNLLREQRKKLNKEK